MAGVPAGGFRHLEGRSRRPCALADARGESPDRRPMLRNFFMVKCLVRSGGAASRSRGPRLRPMTRHPGQFVSKSVWPPAGVPATECRSAPPKCSRLGVDPAIVDLVAKSHHWFDGGTTYCGGSPKAGWIPRPNLPSADRHGKAHPTPGCHRTQCHASPRSVVRHGPHCDHAHAPCRTDGPALWPAASCRLDRSRYSPCTCSSRNIRRATRPLVGCGSCCSILPGK